MKLIMAVSFLIYSLTAFCDGPAVAMKKNKKKKAPQTKIATTPTQAVAPCDSKEDLLKKLEEKKKAEAASEKPKAFSLQGGDTGCSIK